MSTPTTPSTGTKVEVPFGVETLSGTVTAVHQGWAMVRIDTDQPVLAGRQVPFAV
jgi:hypothetical protein